MAADADTNSEAYCPPESDVFEPVHGHFFTKKTFHKPTYCHHCTDMLWGLIGQGYVCEVCNFIVHDRCVKMVVSPCSSIASHLLKNPVPHCWSEPGHFKRKFCNLCRKRLEDSLAIRCEICEYYAHIECQDFVVSDCKECATYVQNNEKCKVKQYHHWREGNLPGNSKCLHCKKTCWSAECLAGMRCEWCGVTAHAACYKFLPVECSFGCLKEILLPPYCLTVPRTDIAMETIFGFQKKMTLPVAEEFSSSGDSKTEDDDKRSPKDKEGRDRDKDREEEIIRIFDGNGSLKKRIYRTVAVPKNVPAQVLLEAALRTFHISDKPRNFYMTEVSEKESGEKEIDLKQPIRNQITSRDGKRPAVFLRYRESHPDRGYIRVHPGPALSNQSPSAGVHFKHIPVTSDTTVHETIAKALERFGSEVQYPESDPSKYKLIEVHLDRGVSEREMDPEERPLTTTQDSRRESLRQHRMTRFYIKQKEDPHGSQVAMYVGNLPTSLSQLQYEKILLDIIGKKKKVPTATLR